MRFRALKRVTTACSFLLLAAGADAAEKAATRFDLRCIGTRETGSTTEPFSTEFRIDLTTRQWCDDRCENVRTFAKIERNRLTFSESESANFTEWTYVERDTGEFHQSLQSDLLNARYKAHCEPVPFKAITSRRRKF